MSTYVLVPKKELSRFKFENLHINVGIGILNKSATINYGARSKYLAGNDSVGAPSDLITHLHQSCTCTN